MNIFLSKGYISPLILFQLKSFSVDLLECKLQSTDYFFSSFYWYHDLDPQPHGCNIEHLPTMLEAFVMVQTFNFLIFCRFLRIN